MKLSIIIPAYNEQHTIQELIQYVTAVKFPLDYEIIIVDDASIDRTYEIVSQQNHQNDIRLFKNEVNRGKGFSIREGIRHAQGNIIMVQDGDKEYNPQDIPRLLKPILEQDAKIVYGSRFLNARRPLGMAFPNWVANKILTRITNWLYGLRLTDMETCYKVFRADVLRNLKLKANRFAFEPEITALAANKKIPIVEIPISYNGRSHKQGKKIKARDFFFAIWTLLKHKIYGVRA